MVILSPSATALQILLDRCSVYSELHDIVYNVKKSACMVINSDKYKITNLPRVYLAGVLLEYVERYKYLGMIIHVRNGDYDITRQLRSIILRTNILLRTFSRCSNEVKLRLFQSYCTNLYCSHLWHIHTKTQLKKSHKCKGSVYLAQYPVRWTAQSALHFLPPLADLFIPTPTRLLREAF